VFAIIAGFMHWFPVCYNLNISPSLLKGQFWSIFLGVNLTFFPQHFLGLNGIPRRYCDYPDSFTYWNTLSRIGRMLTVFRVIFFLFIIWLSLVSEEYSICSVGYSTSVEWLIDSPLPVHTHLEISKISKDAIFH
jgi:cytochrome c oxidase subunit 1